MPKMTSMVLAIILAALAMARHQIMVSAIPMQKSPFLISMFGSTRMANAFLMPAWLLVNIAVAMIRLRESGTLCISSETLLTWYQRQRFSYASPVSYWAPFTDSGCGFHDASWRTNWSSTAYLNDGSNGCVNMHTSDAGTAYDSLTQYEPVIVY